VATFLPYLWFFLVVGMLVLFAVLTGADLGVGIISLLAKRQRRSEIIDAIGPQWYANETWLVIAGATSFGAFPHAFGLILSSLYVPAMMLIFGLMVHAVSAEFRHHRSGQRFWDLAFGAGCLVAALGQGFLLAGLLTNPDALNLPGTGTWNWLNPLSILIAIGAAVACVTLGAARTIHRPTALTPEIWRFWRYSLALSAVIFLILMGLLLAAPSTYNRAWTEGYRVVLVPLLALITLFCLAMAWFNSRKQTPGRGPYTWSVAGLAAVSGLIITIFYPYIIPFSQTIPDASSPESTQFIMLFGVGIVLPIIVFYNIYVARVLSRPERNNRVTGENNHPPERTP
jgi:cytochrome d ubiquinol oxidase subunit II